MRRPALPAPVRLSCLVIRFEYAEDAVMIGRSVILRTQGLTEKKG